MVIVDIDTMLMRQAVSAAATAAGAVDNATAALNRIVDHNDWGCREKTAINQNAAICRTQIQRLQENANAFLDSVRLAADEFDETENNISSWFSHLESVLADAIAVPVVGVGLPSVDITTILSRWELMSEQASSLFGPDALVGRLEQLLPEKFPMFKNGVVPFEFSTLPIAVARFDELQLGESD